MSRIPQVRRIEFNDEEIAMGFNSESGLAVGTALEGFTIEENPAASGMEVLASITIINSHEELMKNLGMSFEAQGRYGFFSASAKAQFSESTNYNSTSTFLVARCIARNPLRRGKNFRVTPAAQALLDALRFDEFKTAFGDSFVRGLQTGGEFYSVVRITSISSAKQNELAATLQAEYNGLVSEGSFEGQFAQANAITNTRSEFTATMYQRAGSGAQISPTVEIREVIKRFKSFPEIAKASPAAYETEVATYDILPLPVPTPEEQESFLFALRDAREKKLRYIQTRNDLEFAFRCLSVGTVDNCLAGTVFLDEDDRPMPLHVSRDVAEFLALVLSGQLRLTVKPSGVSSQFGRFVSNSQFPAAGTLVASGSEVVLQFVELPV